MPRYTSRPARNKYGAKPTVVEGIRFASMKEARRYEELKLLERAGTIHLLALQPALDLMVHSKTTPSALPTKIGQYRGDFAYCECLMLNKSGPCRIVIEDVKGFKTPMYRLKKKMVEAIYGIEIREI